MGRRAGLAVIFLLFFQVTFSQRIYTRGEYIGMYRELAIMEMQRTGVPASITLAQACLESGNGNSVLSRKSNNHFGIKCKNTWTGKRVFHDDDERNECFRKYNSVEESYVDHSNFLSANPRYAGLFKLTITDYKGWAHGLKRAGYATNPHYAHELIRIVEEYQLYQYDLVTDPAQIGRFSHRGTTGANHALINPYQTRKVVLRNELKTIVVKAGDTMESLAAEFNLKPWQMYHFNDYPSGRQPVENEILYLEAKARKAAKGLDTHTLDASETMQYVSQVYGIKLKPLLKRNRLGKNENPPVGTVIYLRDKSPR
ncbi:MAG: glucosaminidase domain-containing protein [Mangrovibacterium sp.]|nr:glucosaminidase domain-containing protein [Mangrovibacterium sp.]